MNGFFGLTFEVQVIVFHITHGILRSAARGPQVNVTDPISIISLLSDTQIYSQWYSIPGGTHEWFV